MSRETENIPTTFKITTFNLCNFVAPPNACYQFDNIYTEEQWQKKQRWIRNYLHTHQPDVIGFQEVFTPDALATLTRELGYSYFCTVEAPSCTEGYIYDKPVVALASRYPIIEWSAVPTNSQTSLHLGLKRDFAFSRLPLRATVVHPILGACDMYVVHLKSKRPTIFSGLENEPEIEDESMLFQTSDVLPEWQQQLTGQWASSLQRTAEAAQLQQAVLARKKETGNPAVIMGDFNDTLTDSALGQLVSNEVRLPATPQLRQKQLKEKPAREKLAPYFFYNSWSLFQASREVSEQLAATEQRVAPEPMGTSKQKGSDEVANSRQPFTFYYGLKGMVLDYILCSAEFNPSYTESLAEVTHFQVFDRHLLNPSFDTDGHSTDHAVVMITIQIRE
ncbi:endonuclease/exonuclease/phosphatase family protein [Photobacterium ganghwense]|uniref:Endonuclease/exonuclease/phosphatase domain-containing protein n=1 Tax=Photobacterium ganghwense TaxID=320778 RepID=A0A0J1HER3_9GAMM|nr:endonuclease/exonuclease/phosphatase family protein [Photobacterium ganghwense]KLV10134.1 hypothetical protein ABT57_06000 [Photobacterium ganghwense]PSU05380.1 endonuclease/exonuclease/phosphatase family protein [Photobacterium ganghwense]